MAERFKLNKVDGAKILRGASIALGGALIAYLADIIPNVDFGQYTEIVVALASVLVNIAYKWLRHDVS